MANHKSAKKRILQNEKSRIRNKGNFSQVKTVIKLFQASLEGSEKSSEKSAELLKSAQSLLHKASKKGIIHDNNASRKISRLSHQFSLSFSQK